MFSRRLRPEGVQGASGKPPACMTIDNLAVRNSPWWGPDAPTPARGQGLQPYGALYCFGRRTEGDWGRAESPQCARRRNPLPPVGPDAPTPARIGTGRPKGRSHFSFGGERKVCKRKPEARRLREKALYCPFLKEGVRNVARSMAKLPTLTFVRARAHSFPLSKRARLFPSAAYRRSAPPQLAWGKLIPCGLGCFDVAGRLCSVDKWADVLFPQSAVGIRSPCGMGCFGVAWVFLQRKRPAGFQNHAGLYCEP